MSGCTNKVPKSNITNEEIFNAVSTLKDYCKDNACTNCILSINSSGDCGIRLSIPSSWNTIEPKEYRVFKEGY